MSAELLPPNSTPLERAVAAAAGRIGQVPAPLEPLWNPATCPPELLPWLAWSFSVDVWDADWSLPVKRAAIAGALAEHRLKGTPAVVDAVLARFDALLTLLEWHQTTPRGEPHTFQVILDLVTAAGLAPGGDRANAAFADKLLAEIYRVKPLREHLEMVQRVRVTGFIGVAAAAQLALFRRLDTAAAFDPDPIWGRYLQTEDGEPLEGGEGEPLEEEPA